MAPLIQSPSISPSSSHDDLFDLKTRNIAPLHELEKETGSTRRVSFCPMSLKYDVMNRENYSHEEFKASWFDIDDMLRMKEDARSTARLYCSGSLALGGDGVSMRGLEHRTREGMKRKRRARMNSYAAVFFELSKRRKNDAYAQEMVAQSYSFYSQQSVKDAQSVARRDAAEAIAIYRKDGCFETNCFQQVIDDLISSMD